MMSGDLVHGRRVDSLEGMVSIRRLCLTVFGNNLVVDRSKVRYGVRYQKNG
jgi:hypothetical protein